MIGLPIVQQKNTRWTESGNTQITHRPINVEIGTDAAQILFWEYINRNFFAVGQPLYQPISQLYLSRSARRILLILPLEELEDQYKVVFA
jgi:hypothetical protein